MLKQLSWNAIIYIFSFLDGDICNHHRVTNAHLSSSLQNINGYKWEKGHLKIATDVRNALLNGDAVVALESTIISHG